jgi:hypothetical protein
VFETEKAVLLEKIAALEWDKVQLNLKIDNLLTYIGLLQCKKESECNISDSKK